MRTRSNVCLCLWENQSKGGWLWVFRSGSVVKTPNFHYRVHGFQFWLETEILHASKCGQKKKKKKKGSNLVKTNGNLIRRLMIQLDWLEMKVSGR